MVPTIGPVQDKGGELAVQSRGLPHLNKLSQGDGEVSAIRGELEVKHPVTKVEVAQRIAPVEVGHDGPALLIHRDHDAPVGRHRHQGNIFPVFKGKRE